MNCLAVPEITLDEWTSRMLSPLQKARYTLSASIELTERCNLNCVHCYINQPANCQSAKASEMSTEQVKFVLGQMAKAGTLFLMITGGEVLLRPDFEEIYLYAKRLGFLLTVFTNGTMISPEIADLLAQFPPRLIEITLNGANAEKFEAVTQVKGSFEQCMKGIRMLVERKLPLHLKTVVLTLNRDELQDIKNLAESLGVPHRYDSSIWPRLDGSHSPYLHRLSAEETLEMDLADPARVEEWYKTGEKFSGIPLRRDVSFTCGAGVRSFHVDSAGKLTPCMMTRRPSFNLLETPFAEAWEQLGEIRKIKRVRCTECEDCLANDLCNQCPGWSQLEHQDYETPDSFVCTIGKQRMFKFGIIKKQLVEEETYG